MKYFQQNKRNLYAVVIFPLLVNTFISSFLINLASLITFLSASFFQTNNFSFKHLKIDISRIYCLCPYKKAVRTPQKYISFLKAQISIHHKISWAGHAACTGANKCF